MSLPRGLKNNNPGNIITSGSPYKGEVIPSQDNRFRQFIAIEWGYRALFHLLRRYITVHNRNTITKIISAWAPSTENNTQNYINNVATWTGINANHILTFADLDKIKKIASAISRMENGIAANIEDVNKGLALLLSDSEAPVNNESKKKS